jgi:hypothetical protein
MPFGKTQMAANLDLKYDEKPEFPFRAFAISFVHIGSRRGE